MSLLHECKHGEHDERDVRGIIDEMGSSAYTQGSIYLVAREAPRFWPNIVQLTRGDDVPSGRWANDDARLPCRLRSAPDAAWPFGLCGDGAFRRTPAPIMKEID